MIVTPGPYGKKGPGGKPPQQRKSHMTPLLANWFWVHGKATYGRRISRSTWS